MQDFKKIVEDLLQELMSELGVSDEQFVAACDKASENPIHKKIVDQIMAVDNFLAFKRLMVKRNQELNRQAIEMFQRMQNKDASQTAGATADGAEATTEGAADKKDDPNAADADALAAAGLLSKEEKEKQAAEMREVMRVAQSLERAEEEEMMKRALAESERVKSEEQKALDEEEEMLKRVMEESAREEAER